MAHILPLKNVFSLVKLSTRMETALRLGFDFTTTHVCLSGTLKKSIYICSGSVLWTFERHMTLFPSKFITCILPITIPGQACFTSISSHVSCVFFILGIFCFS